MDLHALEREVIRILINRYEADNKQPIEVAEIAKRASASVTIVAVVVSDLAKKGSLITDGNMTGFVRLSDESYKRYKGLFGG